MFIQKYLTDDYWNFLKLKVLNNNLKWSLLQSSYTADNHSCWRESKNSNMCIGVNIKFMPDYFYDLMLTTETFG